MLLPGGVSQGVHSLPIYTAKKPAIWEHAATNSANHIWRMYNFYLTYQFNKHLVYIQNGRPEVENLRSIIDYYIKSDLYLDKVSINDSRDLQPHKDLWIAIAFNAIKCIKNYFNKDIDIQYVIDTVIKKQKDYGHNNIAMFAITGLVIRIHDKIARSENILAKQNMENAVPGESLYDTFLDMIGYSIIALMWLEGTFMLPLGEEE
jgi:hypothetical protein